MLQKIVLDDERFAEIAEKARLKAPEYFPAWNDLNTHDPGVTLIELFAWLTEQQRFYIERSGDAAALLPLLCITRRRACAADAEVTLQGGFAPREIKAHTPLFAGDVRFETSEDARYDGNPLTLRVVQCETMRTPFTLGCAAGFPGEKFYADLRGRTNLRERFSLEVDGERWTVVDDFRASRNDDKHYVLDDETGEITFGDGIRGAIAKGEITVTSMALTRGPGGNIAPHRLRELAGLPVSQPEAAKGGAARESASEAAARTRDERRQAVTARDVERLALETPGVAIECVRAYEEEAAPRIGEPRVIELAVKLSAGVLTEDVQLRILRRLEPYRLVCRDFRILAPKIIPVGLTLEICARPRGANFRRELERSIRAFFARRYGDFGAKLRLSEIRAFVSGTEEVLEVSVCAFRVHGARADADGGFTLPPGALVDLGEISLRITDAMV